MKKKISGDVFCPACNNRMSSRKKHHKYWKCWRNGIGCKGILKADGTFIHKKR